MAFTPYNGTDGRLKAVLVAADLSVPAPTITGTVASISGITKFSINFEDQHGEPITHFESAATTNGMLWGQQLSGGTQIWTADVEGLFDGDTSATMTLFENGCWVKADFVYDKNTNMGHHACGAKVSGFKSLGPDVKTPGAIKFSCKLLGHGALPAIATS